jgi:pimeloyl-ACP methyl ester carboxylesterase
MADLAASLQKSTTDRANTSMEDIVRRYFSVLSAIAPGLAERQAVRLFLSTRPRRTHTPGAIGGVEPRAHRLGSGRTAFRAWSYGSGPTVLLVHGWRGCAGDWAPLAERLLASGYRVVTCDLPAHGLSPGSQTTLPDLVRAIHTLAYELAPWPVGRHQPLEAVVAHSFGAAASVLAAGEGLSPRSLVLLAPVAHPMSFVAPVAKMLGLSPERTAGMVDRIRVRVGGSLDRIDVLRALRTVDARGLVVHDRGDSTVPYGHAREIVSAWPDARLVTASGLGHRGVLQDAALLDEVAAFIGAA